MSTTAEVRTVTIGRQPVRVAIRRGQNEPGQPPRVPLLLINGIGAHLELLEPFVRELDPAIEVIRFDPPGIGGSPSPARPYWFGGLCKLIASLLTELGYDQVDVLGISWGGGVAQHFAGFQRSRCRRLVLVATATGTVMLPARPSVLRHMVTPRRHLDREHLQRIAGQIYGGLARIDTEETAAAMHDDNRGGPSRGYLYQLAASAGWTSVPFLRLLRQPVLIVAGDDDPIIPLANAKLMKRLIPNSRLHVYHGGHLGLVTEAADLAPVVDAFLAAPLTVSRRVQAGASPQPWRWPSLVTAPHSGQTRWAQHAASPPAAGPSSCRRSRARTAAWLCSTSLVAVSKVSGPAEARARRRPSSVRCAGPDSSSR
jgi:poly(3-hydroxyalkanoate) depolymerase